MQFTIVTKQFNDDDDDDDVDGNNNNDTDNTKHRVKTNLKLVSDIFNFWLISVLCCAAVYCCCRFAYIRENKKEVAEEEAGEVFFSPLLLL